MMTLRPLDNSSFKSTSSDQDTSSNEHFVQCGPPVAATGEVWSNQANAGDIAIERCDYCPPEETEEKGVLENIKEKAIDIKDKITGNTPEKKAEKYAKKCEKCLKKEQKHEKEAEKYAEKAAEKSQKYADKAAKELDKKTEMEEKAACYHAKAVENSERARECRDSKIDAQGDLKFKMIRGGASIHSVEILSK
uniref:Uncharacterized protein n=1 Tax=Acrobeloides nanus TaxID=290746 RepID=A0A914E7A6_9BILA